jgi:MFS family permease
MAGLTQNYTTPFALTMKATTTQIGLLSSIPNLAMSLAQLLAPGLSQRMRSRKGFILPMVFLHALMWLPILLIPYIFHNHQVMSLIAFLTMSTVFDSISNPAWGSMMADLLSPESRGRFFSSRNRITGLIAMIFSYVAGGILQLLTGNTDLGFSIIFAVALVFRLVSLYFLYRMYEPLQPTISTQHVSLLTISRRAFSSNVGRAIIFCGFLSFSTNLAAPFFSPYMLRELKFSYLTYTIVNSASALATLGFMTYWGTRSDKAGTVKVIKTSMLLIPFVPIAWLISSNVYWIILVQVFSGFAWAGFSLSSTIFIFDASPQNDRTRYIALFNAMMFGGVFLGALVGGVLTPLLPQIKHSQFLTIFLFSGVARMIVGIILLPRVSEVRDVPKMSTGQFLFGGLELAKIKGLPHSISQQISRLKNRRHT